jgi:alpha-mannosidase
VAFLVFNLTGASQSVPVEYEPWLTWQSREARHLLDDSGREVPYQDLHPECYANGVRRILFTPDVPPYGYRLFRFALGTPSAVPSPVPRVTETVLENGRWHIAIDGATGGIARLEDRQTGNTLLSGTAHLAMAVDDPTDTWSHGVDRFGLSGQIAVCERVEVIERGPLRVAVRVHTRIGESTISSTYLLHADAAQPIEIRVRIDWRGKRRLLRLCYPLALAAPSFRYEVPYGSVERPADGREWPGQRWVLVTSAQDGYGVALANDAKYSYAADGGTLYLTVLRSPVLAHHDPYALAPDEDYPYADQGEQCFTIRLCAGPAVGARDAYLLAEALHRPPVVTPHVARGGQGPWQAGLFAVEAQSTVLGWLKMAEDGDELVARLLEVAGVPDSVTLPGSADRRPIGAYSLITLRGDPRAGWRVSDGLEG